MKLLIPMAGKGKRVRPISLTTPKPLIKIAGKPIVHRIIEELAEIVPKKINEIGFIVGNFDDEIIENLKVIAKNLDAIPHIFHQNVPLGTAHAIHMAKDFLEGEVIIAFADTLFIANQKVNLDSDAVIFTKQVEDPSQYGVVVLNENQEIIQFVEKPKQPVSDLAIIGIYYFKQAEILREKIQYLIDNDLKVNGEYQLTDALEAMLKENVKFTTYTIDEWLDCGNLKVLRQTTKRILEYIKNKENLKLSSPNNSVIIEPVYIGKNVTVENSVIGPYVTIEDNSKIKNSIISNSIILEDTEINNANLTESVIGNHAQVTGNQISVEISDYSKIKS